jgi:hypothetical protein
MIGMYHRDLSDHFSVTFNPNKEASPHGPVSLISLIGDLLFYLADKMSKIAQDIFSSKTRGTTLVSDRTQQGSSLNISQQIQDDSTSKTSVVVKKRSPLAMQFFRK